MSITPEIDLETYDTPHCPECGQDIDTWPIEKRAIEQGKERIIAELERERVWLISTDDEDNLRDAEGVLVAIELLRGENK